MPIPEPKSGENQNDYVSRCMSALKDDDKPQKQKVAICFTTWRQKKTKNEIKKKLYDCIDLLKKAKDHKFDTKKL